MRIDHVALWTSDLERCKQFYCTYFGALPGAGYVNAAKGFASCFLSFDDGARIEAMTTTTLSPLAIEPGDLLAILSAGAYGMAMSSNYNTRPRAAEVMVDGDKAFLVRRREAIEDLYALESLLP